LRNTARILSIAAIACWVGSLFLPALSFQFDSHHDRVLFGYQVLASGYWHLLVFEFSWVANFVFWIVVWLIWTRPERSRSLLTGSVATALLTIQSVEIFIFNRFFESPKPFSGYYLWVVANLLLAIAAFALARSASSRFAPEPV
jgi:hypothetical protein